MRPTKRTLILEAALDLYRRDDAPSVTLESVAHRAGLTKAGLMYHFGTKDQLMLGIVGHVADEWVACLEGALRVPLDDATPEERTRAYVDAALAYRFDRADFAVYAEAVRVPALRNAWTDRLAAWFRFPEDLPADRRAALTLAQLAADGLWIADATDVFSPRAAERTALAARLHDLVGGR